MVVTRLHTDASRHDTRNDVQTYSSLTEINLSTVGLKRYRGIFDALGRATP